MTNLPSIYLPGDEDILAKAQSGEELNELELVRYRQLEQNAKQALRESIGEDKLEYLKQEVIKTDKSDDYIAGMIVGLRYGMLGITSLPKYSIPLQEGQELHVVPSDMIENLQMDLTALCILYEEMVDPTTLQAINEEG